MIPSKTSIETVSGIYVDLADPKPEMINIVDIAWGLSRQARFAGHTITDLPYSVAQHSIFVAEIVEKILDPSTKINDKFSQSTVMEWTELLEFINDPMRRNWTIWKALMHDAGEAYLIDLPSPVKRMPGIAESYGAAEKKIMSVILQSFGYRLSTWVALDAQVDAIIHWADLYARAIEAHHFMVSRGKHWGLEKPSISELHSFRQPIPALQAYDEFMNKFELLLPHEIKPGD